MSTDLILPTYTEYVTVREYSKSHGLIFYRKRKAYGKFYYRNEEYAVTDSVDQKGFVVTHVDSGNCLIDKTYLGVRETYTKNLKVLKTYSIMVDDVVIKEPKIPSKNLSLNLSLWGL